MKYKSIKLDIDRIIFGFGPKHIILKTFERKDILKMVLRTGIYQFETAPFYALGQNETILGHFKNKKKIRIITKFGFNNLILPKILINNHFLSKIINRLYLNYFYPKNTDYMAMSAAKSIMSSISRLKRIPEILLLHGTKRNFTQIEKKIFFENITLLKKKFNKLKIGIASADENTVKIFNSEIDVIMTSYDIFKKHLSHKIDKNKIYLLYGLYKYWEKNYINIKFFNWLHSNMNKYYNNVKFILTTTDKNKINSWRKYLS
jgi:aryl-alcohol dehydrogenase-like predicted oxidoreductase